MPVPLRRPRTPPALPPRRVPPPSFRGSLTSSYAPPILPGPSTRIVLCKPVDQPTGRPKTEPAHGFSAAANTFGPWKYLVSRHSDRCFATVSTSAEVGGPARSSDL